MSNISPAGPNTPRPNTTNVPESAKNSEDIKGLSSSSETIAGSLLTSQMAANAALLNSFRNALIEEFGPQIGDAAFVSIRAEMLQGKNLSFDVVKQAVLDSARKFNETISENALLAFKDTLSSSQNPRAIQDAFKSFSPMGSDSAVREALNDAAIAMSKASKSSTQRLEDIGFEELKEDIQKKQDIKRDAIDEQIKQRLRNPGDRV